MRRIALGIAIFAGTAGVTQAAAQAVVPASAGDEQAVRGADDAFWRAFNACDAASMAVFLADDVEFYHDITGLTRSREAVAASLMKGPCGTPGLHMRRELVAESLRYQAIPRYGAMLTGEHLFHARQGNAPERPATLARFLVIWRLQSGHWLMTRVVSYDHRPAPYRPAATPVVVPSDTLKLYVGRYHAEGAGDIDVTLENNALTLRSGTLRLGLAASAPGRFFALDRDLNVNFSDESGTHLVEIEENGAVVARGVRTSP
jgi:hypothetical protein